MFEALTERFHGIVRQLSGQARITPDNIRESLRDVRRALLEADVPVQVAKDFVAKIEVRAVGEEVLKSLKPGQQVVGIVHEELINLLGNSQVTLAGSHHVPTVVVLAGLQGSGKTTFAGKLAVWLKARGKRTLLSSADIYRPAAIDQLERSPRRRAPASIARRTAPRRATSPRRRWTTRASAASTSSFSTPPGGCTSTKR